MKRILITIILLLTTTIGFSQLNLEKFDPYKKIDGIKGSRYFNATNDGVDLILETNPNVANVRLYNTHVFDDGVKYLIYIFTDDNENFLDLIVFIKRKNIRYEIFSINYMYYDRQRKVIDFTSDNKTYDKFYMTDGSYIKFDYEPKGFLFSDNINSKENKKTIANWVN